MAFGQPQQQTNAMGQVAQPGRTSMGMGAVSRPPLSGSAVKRGPNQSRMDPLGGQLQSAMMARNMGGGAPPPPNPGIGPSEPAMNQMMGSLGGNQNMGMPSQPAPLNDINPPSPMPDNPQAAIQAQQGQMGMMMSPDKLNAIIGMYKNLQGGGQGGPMGQRLDVMPRGPMNTGPMIGQPPSNGMSGMIGAGGSVMDNYLQNRKQVQPQMGQRGGMGIGPSFMGNAQPIQQMGQQPPNQPAPMTQSRRFGGGMGMNQ